MTPFPEEPIWPTKHGSGLPTSGVSASPETGKRTVLAGIFVRRECWTLSFFGKLLTLIAAVLAFIICLKGLYPFLAYSDRMPSRVLVVDGWLPTYLLQQAAAEYSRGKYDRMLTVQQTEPYTSVELEKSRDNYVVEILVRHGVPRESIAPILYPNTDRDRTYHSALAIKEWIHNNDMTLTSFNIVTVGPHARRSRLIYKRVFEKRFQIGVLGLTDPAYDAVHWWRSSEGVREVLFEGFAYLYVRLVPSPDQ